MEKGVIALILVFLVFLTGMVFFVIQSKDEAPSYSEREVPYLNIGSGLISEMTPQSIFDNKDVEFWSQNMLIKKQFFIETKFGQSKDNNLIFNYSISSSEDCEKEFDKKNYTVATYIQTVNIGPERYELHPAKACLLDSISPLKLECLGSGQNQSCLYVSKVSCVCFYGTPIK